MAKIKVSASKDTVEGFQQIILAKHRKLELSAEGEEALRLYIKKYENLLGMLCPPESDPLARICGIGRSSASDNVLKDVDRFEAGE
jgi:hypothetical protein